MTLRSSSGAINLTAFSSVNIPLDIPVQWNSSNKITSNGTNVTIMSSSGAINLTAFSTVNVPVNIPFQWNSGNKISSNGTNLDITSSGIININGSSVFNTATSSSSLSTASCIFYGGISINNSSNASSINNGGTITSNGGYAFNGDGYIGGKIDVGNTSASIAQSANQGINIRSRSRTLTTTLNVDTAFNSFDGGIISLSSGTITNASTCYISGSPTITSGSITNAYSLFVGSGNSKFNGNMTISNTLTCSTNIIVSNNISIAGVVVTPNIGDISTQISFNGANNVSSASNITGLLFSTVAVKSFTATVLVSVTASSNLYEQYTIQGIYNGSGWYLVKESVGDNTGVIFTITSGGQVQYTSLNYSGFSSIVFRFRANTIN